MFHIRRLKPTAKDKAPSKVVANNGTLMEQYYWFNALSFAVHFSERIEGGAKETGWSGLVFHIRRLKPTAKDKAPIRAGVKDKSRMEQAVVHILIFKGILDQIILYKL